MCREDGKGPCDRQSVTYDIKFAECKDIYVGEASRSAYTKGKDQMKSLAKKEESSALWISTVKGNTTVKCINLK